MKPSVPGDSDPGMDPLPAGSDGRHDRAPAASDPTRIREVTPASEPPATAGPQPPAPTIIAPHRDDTHVPSAGAPATPGAGPARIGPYEILGELGRGGMGVVYKAWHPGLRALVAVKLLLAGSSASAAEVARFEREAQAAARLRHPGILAVHAIGRDQGRTWFAMEYVEGANLDRVLDDPASFGLSAARRPPAATAAARGGRPGLPADVAVRLVRDVADALACAHDAGIIHRDLKPANVLRTHAGVVKVMDFGLARMVDAGGTGVTASGTVLGTPAYMSPEQAEGRIADLDARSDVYQLGALLYELLTGRPPYAGETAFHIILQVVQHEPRPVRRWNPWIDRDAETLCSKAMARDPGARYSSARAMAEDCRRFLAGEALLAQREAWWRRPWRWCRRRPAVAAGALVAVLAATTAAGSAYDAWAGRQTQEQLRGRVRAQLREQAAIYLDAALRLRRAGLPLDRVADYGTELARTANECEAVEPGRAEPYVLMARFERARNRSSEAIRLLEAALAREPEHVEAHLERASLRLRALVALLVDVLWALDKSAPEGSTAAVALYADPALLRHRGAIEEDLAFVRGRLPADHPRLRALEAIQTLYDGNSAAAAATCDAVLQVDPALEEALSGRFHVAVLLQDFATAERVMTQAIEGDRGNPDLWRDRALALSLQAKACTDHGLDERAITARAIADLDQALTLEPGSSVCYWQRGQARANLAVAEENRGGNPLPLYDAALADYDEAVRRSGEGGEVRVARALVRSNRAAARMARGDAAEDDVRLAQADCDAALQQNSTDPGARLFRGTLHANVARFCIVRGLDPATPAAAALDDFAALLQADPRHATALARRGHLRLHLGFSAERTNGPVETLYLSAHADAADAASIATQFAEPRQTMAEASFRLATWLQSQGRPFETEARRAIAEATNALELHARHLPTAIIRGMAFVLLADVCSANQQDPIPELTRARADFDLAVQWQPNSAEALGRRGRMTYYLEGGKAGLPDLEAAARLQPGYLPWLVDEVRLAARADAAVSPRAPWRETLKQATAALQAQDYAAAERLYQEGLAAFELARDALTAEDRTRLASISWAVYPIALAALDHAALLAAIAPGPTEDLAQRRNRAFARIGLAIDLGVRDERLIVGQPAFASLSEDPRWLDLLSRIRAGK